jgi:hypothetical protein
MFFSPGRWENPGGRHDEPDWLLAGAAVHRIWTDLPRNRSHGKMVALLAGLPSTISWKGNNCMKVVVLVLALTAGFGGACLSGQPPMQPVPAKWLHDGKLVVEELNFSIQTPSPGSKWTYYESTIKGLKGTLFLVVTSVDTKFSVLVADEADTMNEYNTKRFVNGFKESIPKDWVVDEAILEPSAFPLKGSSKLTITMRLPNNVNLAAYSERCRSPFRGDGDRDSELMPITIPR